MMVIVFLDFLQFSQICQEMVWDSGFQLDVTVLNLAGFRLYTSEQIYNIHGLLILKSKALNIANRGEKRIWCKSCWSELYYGRPLLLAKKLPRLEEA